MVFFAVIKSPLWVIVSQTVGLVKRIPRPRDGFLLPSNENSFEVPGLGKD